MLYALFGVDPGYFDRKGDGITSFTTLREMPRGHRGCWIERTVPRHREKSCKRGANSAGEAFQCETGSWMYPFWAKTAT